MILDRTVMYMYHRTRPTIFLLRTYIYTLENHCTRTAHTSRGGVHKIVYLAVKKGKYFGQYFAYENIHLELQ